MRTYTVVGTVEHEITVMTEGGYEDAADAFRSQFGKLPDTINDRDVYAKCVGAYCFRAARTTKTPRA